MRDGADSARAMSSALAACLSADLDVLCARAGGRFSSLSSGDDCEPAMRAQIGQTPALWAAANGHPEALQVLIEARADVNTTGKVSISRGADGDCMDGLSGRW